MASSSTLASLAGLAEGTLHSDDPDAADIRITDVTHDSRGAAEGTLFVAVRGSSHDGHDFINLAVDAGSPAVCVDHVVGSGVPEIVVDDTRAALGPLAAAVHGHPSRSLAVIGVTGTNGKTTVTHYIESIASSAGIETGLIGTVSTRIGAEELSSVRTTPEATDFQRLLSAMRDKGARVVACEVSSHALTLGRVAATRFEVAAFTNLSHDHLDFHGDMDSYWQAKRSLFTDYEVGTAVVNLDDPVGNRLVADVRSEVLTVGSDGDVRVTAYRHVGSGTEIEMRTPWGSLSAVTPVVGSFNVSNVAVAVACCLATGVELVAVEKGLPTLQAVPGRFEEMSHGPLRVVVDYAHTPDGISKAIEAARDLGPARVIVVVGAGGDRDHDKRPMMGEAASEADLVVVTSDNPRGEDPAEIVSQVMAGIPPGHAVTLEADRVKAIGAAVLGAEDGDLVLILGRGHEAHQEAAGRLVPLDDRDIARRALKKRGVAAESGGGSRSMSA